MGSYPEIPRTDVREGTTERIVMQLLADDVIINLNAIHHVEIELRDRKRTTYKYSSLATLAKVGVLVAPEGTVYFDPPATLFKVARSPYTGYIWVYETATNKYSVPEDSEFYIGVRKNF